MTDEGYLDLKLEVDTTLPVHEVTYGHDSIVMVDDPERREPNKSLDENTVSPTLQSTTIVR